MKTFVWKDLDLTARRAVLARPENRRDERVSMRVRQIFDEIEASGFDALSRWAIDLDGYGPECVNLNPQTVDQARAQLSSSDLAAMELAIDNVRAFHQAEKPTDGAIIDPREGLRLQRLYRPISTAGLYIPGGTAPLFSTLIMTAIPALVAGVPNRIAITPPAKDGSIHPMMIAVAAASGLDDIWKLGGAHGIAALAFGLLGGNPADKLYGPGNKYVAEAKRLATERVSGLAIDMPAGPSELLCIVDESCEPAFVAADLLSQAEHDVDAQVVLVSIGELALNSVKSEILRQVATLPRADIALASLEQARFIVADNISECAEISNLYAPEHLALQVNEEDALISQLTAAGTIFAGRYAAETFGDYVAGPSHVLPTDSAARAYDGITVRSFMTSFVVQKADLSGAHSIAPAAAALARLEGLEAHARAADIRMGIMP